MNPQATPESEDTTYRPLARYTNFVRSTKVTLGVVAFLLICLILFFPLLKQQPPGMRISLTSTSDKPPPSATAMTNARFHGLDKDNQLYTIFARKVSEVSEDRIDLTQPSGEIFLKTAQHLAVQADSGVYSKKGRMLNLKGAVTMNNSDGYKLTTATLAVDIGNNTAATATEVFGNGPLGTLKAYGGAMADSENQQIIFLGPVFVTLIMDGKDKKEKKE